MSVYRIQYITVYELHNANSTRPKQFASNFKTVCEQHVSMIKMRHTMREWENYSCKPLSVLFDFDGKIKVYKEDYIML